MIFIAKYLNRRVDCRANLMVIAVTDNIFSLVFNVHFHDTSITRNDHKLM
jgi:hypothetical protein